MNLSAITCVPIMRDTEGELTHTEEEEASDHRDRDWSDVAKSQGMQASWKRQGMDPPLEPLEGT